MIENNKFRFFEYALGQLNKRMQVHFILGFNWVFDQYKFKSSDRVIEFGCGNGTIWDNNRNKIPKDIKVVLTDLSEGMLRTTKDNLVGIEQVIIILREGSIDIPKTSGMFIAKKPKKLL